MSQIHQDKRTKGQILRLLDHAMQQEEKFAEKIQSLESQLAECRKRAEDPRYEITESAIPASKVSFRLDYYRTEKKGPVRGIIEHLSSRESKSFGSEDGFDIIQQFVGKYLPVKARQKNRPIAPPSPFLEKMPAEAAPMQPEAVAEMEAQPAAQVLENEPTAEAALVQPEAAAELTAPSVAAVLENEPTAEAASVLPEAAAELTAPSVAAVLENEPTAEAASVLPEAAAELAAPSVAAVLENEPTAEAASALPEAAAELTAPPVAAVLETAPAAEPPTQTTAPETSANNLRLSRLSDLPSTPLAVNERFAARIRRSLSLPAESAEPEQRLAIATHQPAAAPVLAPEIPASPARRLQQSGSLAAPAVGNERLAARIRRSLSLPAESAEPEEVPAAAFRQPAVVHTPVAKKSHGKTAVFSVVAEGGEQHQAALQHEQHFQVEIPTAQLPEFQGKPCHARLIAENLETGEQVRAIDACQPGPSALRFPKRSMQLPSGGYRLTAVLGLATDPRTVFYRESRLVVVK